MEMLGQIWRHTRLLKQLSKVVLAFAVCLSLSRCLFVYVRLHATEDTRQGLLGNLALPATLQPLNLGNVSLGRSKHERKFWYTSDVTTEDSERVEHVFHSPFIVTYSNQEKIGDLEKYDALVNRSSEQYRPKTFAVIWPCKNDSLDCFRKTRFPEETCRFNRCRQTWVLENADVVVFYVYRIKQSAGIPKFIRPSHQRWVMLTPESPARKSEFAMLDFAGIKGQFNWTQTYRLDSDIPRLYGKLHRRQIPVQNYDEIYRHKNVTAAWFVSHCITPANREMYVKKMQGVADIHVYGSCGNYTCKDRSYNKRALDKDQCLPMLSKFYFFYLSFENSICKDYVTEKFFKLFQNVDVIPVVRGGANYKRYFSPDTFVDASDFKSPEDLARFLLDLAKDKNRYISMLREKSRYQLWSTQRWFCDLCEKMHQYNTENSYSDLRDWFVRDQCREPNDM